MAKVTLPISFRFTARSESLNADSNSAEVPSSFGTGPEPETTCVADTKHPDVPDDGVNLDEYDVSCATTNWIVRKTFLELEPMESVGMTMRGCKSDAWVVGARKAHIAHLNRVSLNAWGLDENSVCDSTCSTREPSTEDVDNVVMRRQKSVKFAATEEVQLSSNDGTIINVTRVLDNDCPRQRTRTESHPMKVRTASSPTHRRRAESKNSIMSMSTVDSPMCRTRSAPSASVLRSSMTGSPMYRGRSDSRASVTSTRTTDSRSPTCRMRFETDFSPAYVYNSLSFGMDSQAVCGSLQQRSTLSTMAIAERSDHASADSYVVQSSVPMSAMVPLLTGQVVMLNPCTLAMSSAKPAPVAPPSQFPRCSVGVPRTEATEEVKEAATEPSPTVREAFAGPPGIFYQAQADLKVTKIPAEFKEVEKHQEELKELEDQQKRLQEQRERLLAMSGVSSGVSMPHAFSHKYPPGQWTQPQDIDQICAQQQRQSDIKLHERTTLVLRNLPDGFTRAKIEQLLNAQGFAKRFNFIYAPVRFETMTISGFAFVNFVSPEAAHECLQKLDGFSGWDQPHENVCEVIWSEKDQGLSVIIDRHRNSPVMHSSVREEFKPAVYNDGIQIMFPAPTKKVRPPKVQKCKKDGNGEC